MKYIAIIAATCALLSVSTASMSASPPPDVGSELRADLSSCYVAEYELHVMVPTMDAIVPAGAQAPEQTYTVEIAPAIVPVLFLDMYEGHRFWRQCEEPGYINNKKLQRYSRAYNDRQAVIF